MANILWPVALIWILVWIILWNLLNWFLRNSDLTEFIITIIMIIIIFIYIFKASKYVASKYEFNNLNKVSITSTISFLAINLLFVTFLSLFATINWWNSEIWFFELIIKVLWLNSVYTYLFLVVFYFPYYFLTLKSLNKYKKLS